jgi:hypothetical protein
MDARDVTAWWETAGYRPLPSSQTQRTHLTNQTAIIPTRRYSSTIPFHSEREGRSDVVRMGASSLVHPPCCCLFGLASEHPFPTPTNRRTDDDTTTTTTTDRPAAAAGLHTLPRVETSAGCAFSSTGAQRPEPSSLLLGSVVVAMSSLTASLVAFWVLDVGNHDSSNGPRGLPAHPLGSC